MKGGETERTTQKRRPQQEGDPASQRKDRGDTSKAGGVKRQAEKASLHAIRHSRRTHIIASPGTYQAKTGLSATRTDTLEDIQKQGSMTDLQEDVGGEAYPGGDAYSEQALAELPSEGVQRLIVRLRSLIPGCDTPVDVTHTPAGPAFQAVLEETGLLGPQQEVDETIQ